MLCFVYYQYHNEILFPKQTEYLQILWANSEKIDYLSCINKFKFKLMNLGKNELLNWINQIMETEYTTVETLGDGVAYAQMIDAIHPGSINIFKINLNTKYPDDCQRNVKIVEDSLKKLQLSQPVSYEKISKGKFHDNIVFLQWLYGYVTRYGLESLQFYSPFDRRLQILDRQNKRHNQMNQHLIPNKAYKQEIDWEAGVDAQQNIDQQEEEQNQEQLVELRLQKLNDYVRSLENDLKQKMELSWRLMHLVDKSIEERNSLFSLLKHIDGVVTESPVSPLKDKLESILHETPEEFQ